ncbi:DUF262 domain-containing protein [Paraburkholderia solisilvae]|uniref:DUF262 domain-containing protein n=1 Tax=Paraburkholderia solisilvae TaxID=624376 RepID=A0A6J5ECQ6_9BURK|nr:DUF262 domain-containing protein [Paraburkholderia solisilvae]CAB3763111.1 hypothetical protein LMG29739_04034 [Paraburkholderia solisilvae]
MQTELISLSKAFTENLYRIPDYQRGYAWGLKQLKDFWNDIAQLPDRHNHYTGVLTLEAAPKSATATWEDDLWIIEAKNYQPHFVVDGQQRLTTAIILIQVILEATQNGETLNFDTKEEIQKRYIYLTKDGGISRSYIFGYEKDNPSYEYLITHIFQEQSDRHSTVEETIYTKNLSFAKEYFQEKIKDYSAIEREKLYTKITQNLLFNVFTIREDVDVFVTFETMNNRGKPLSNLELLKNRLIYLSTKFIPNQDGEHSHDRTKLRRTINECWKSAYHYLGKNKARVLDDNFFLLVQFLMYFNVALPRTEHAQANNSLGLYKYKQEEGYKEYLLDEFFTARRVTDASIENPLSVDAIYAYAKDIKDTVKVYHEIFNPEDSKLSGQEKMHLERIGRLRNYDVILLLTAMYKKKPPQAQRISFLEQLERMLFFRTIRSYHFHNIDLEEDGVLFIAGKKTFAEIVKSVSDCTEEFIKSKDFKESIANLGKGGGYYGWAAIRYFMFEYEQYLKSQTKTNRDKLSWEDFRKENFKSDYVSVEHIYPQRAAHASWNGAFSKYKIPQRNILKNSIGNLVPLSIPKNSSLGNRPFVDKKGSREQKVGYSYGCYSEIEVSHEDEWTPHHILARGLRLLNFMEDRWKVDFGTDRNKTDLLGLGFLDPTRKLKLPKK